uniref:Uncharacterized protein n=1 Tax=Manihot esculenta TaxID=3983 RepID=A0A2C9U8K2_MANES
MHNLKEWIDCDDVLLANGSLYLLTWDDKRGTNETIMLCKTRSYNLHSSSCEAFSSHLMRA